LLKVWIYSVGIIVQEPMHVMLGSISDLNTVILPINEMFLWFIIEEFGNLLGLKLNKNKTEGIWLGRLKHTKDK
jgi:hypothetical protein